MIDLRELRARTVDLQSIQISWEVVPTIEEILDYQFQVLRSEAQGGPWQEMCAPFTDRYLFLDNLIEPFHMHRRMYYLLRVTCKAEVRDWGPISLMEEPDLIALEIRRHWDLKLREFSGRRCWLFPVRTFGTTCSGCYDPITGRVTRTTCEQCYGTGFNRGFHHPLEVWIQVQPHEKGEKIGGAIVQHEGVTSALAPAFPTFKPRDLIVEPNHIRWRVATVSTTERLRTTLHQQLAMAMCAPSDIEFQIPVEVADLPRMELAASRNYRYRTSL